MKLLGFGTQGHRFDSTRVRSDSKELWGRIIARYFERTTVRSDVGLTSVHRPGVERAGEGNPPFLGLVSGQTKKRSQPFGGPCILTQAQLEVAH